MDANEKLFSEYRNELLKRQLSNTENYDKALLTLSSSGLALSLTISQLITPAPLATGYLCTAWILFGLTIACSISSYIASNLAINKQIEISERYYLKGELSAYNEKNWPSLINNALNYISGFCFLGAILSTIFFFNPSLAKKEVMMSNKNDQYVSTTDSASIPKMVIRQPENISINSAQVPKMQAIPAPLPINTDKK